MQLPEIQRRKTRAVDVGGVVIGGGNPVVIQGMTKTRTADVDTTLGQVKKLAKEGAELVRVAVPSEEDTRALKDIVQGSPVPIIADVHFHYKRALEAIEAGAAKIRLNPGNIDDPGQIDAIIEAAKAAGTAMRVGVNAASLPAGIEGGLVDAMAGALGSYLEVFESRDFDRIVLSAKSPDACATIEANLAIAERWDYPLHLGVTHSGTPRTGVVRSAAALGALLSQGIGDTLRISYAGDPIEEVRAAKELLCSLRLREREGVELIACPTCGRIQMDLEEIIEQVEEQIMDMQTSRPVRVAIMGCNVNGPGEAADADIAVCAGKDEALLYRAGEPAGKIAREDIVRTIIEEIGAICPGGSGGN
jgi:(E)-4-hydroxy-3-methylbut-2-enyl-diphosphate synthase